MSAASSPPSPEGRGEGGGGTTRGGSLGGVRGAEKWSKASLAASFWASLEDRQGLGVWKGRPFTETVPVKRGMWSGPSFTTAYSGKLHDRWWHSSCSFVLYILLGSDRASKVPSGAFAESQPFYFLRGERKRERERETVE